MTEVTPRLFRGPAPKSFAALKKQGIKSVINLEVGVADCLSEMTECGTLELSYVSLPQNAIFPPSRSEVEKVLSFIEIPELAPFYIHCRHGVDRTGYICAVYRIRYCGYSLENAIREMKLLGFHTPAYFWWLPFLRKYC